MPRNIRTSGRIQKNRTGKSASSPRVIHASGADDGSTKRTLPAWKISFAKINVIADRKQDRESAAWIRELADERPH